MNNKCKVLLLPTDKESNIHFDKIENELTYTKNKVHYSNRMVESRQLFVLSDDEIKEGDWFICLYTNIIQNVITGFEKRDCCKKIIAATNSDLIKEGIASIDDEFIRDYCNNAVEEVLVEYYTNSTVFFSKLNPKIDKSYIGTPKLSSNDSILIKPIEETWDDIFEKIPFNPRIWFDWLKENYEVPKKK